ncbi:MAG TPA: Gfo/Idh/MocA family oxidoreductase [Pirellulaceae bacterium]|nr:Gfo/Idh/MocA family oxidoreductase [Pirellulaceae bacterium]
MKRNRRDFLKSTAVAGAAASVPYFWTAEITRAQDSNTKRTVAAIGVGGSRGRYNQGGAVANRAAQFGQMIAVCDVDSVHTAEFSAKHGGKLKEYVDYRELLAKEKPDVVTIGTPDHWHVPIAIAALRAGCDVYCEKPLTLTIDEGKQVARVVQETGKVFQVGTQQRSEDARRFLDAVAMVQGGYLGDNVNAYVAIGGAPGNGPFEPTAAPEGLNWDFWVGPAQEAPYMEERRKDFRWFLEYSGGKMTDWGAHHIDIAQWALGCDNTGPTEISGTGKFGVVVPEKFDFNALFTGKEKLPHGFNAATVFDIDIGFASGSTMKVTNHYKSEDGTTDFDNGILFVGDKGRIFVNRGKLTGAPVEALTDADRKNLDEAVAKLYKGKSLKGHMANFFDCMEDRTDPISDVYTHHRTMTSCHLCNITLMLGRKLQWDPVKEDFVNDPQASALMSRPSRSEYLA